MKQSHLVWSVSYFMMDGGTSVLYPEFKAAISGVYKSVTAWPVLPYNQHGDETDQNIVLVPKRSALTSPG
jgi:hypothetical protein